MRSSIKKCRLWAVGVRSVLVGIVLLLACSCEEEKDVFERRYVLTRISGFEIEDHIGLLDHKDPNLRYLALANLLQMGALAQADENGEKGGGVEDLVEKLRALLDDPVPKVRAIAAYAPINRAGKGAEERLLARLDDKHSAVRVEALVSLGEGEWGARGELSPAGTERVARLLEDDNVLVRLHALEALGSSGSAQRAEAMVGKIELALARRETPEVLKALEVLGWIDSDAAEKILMGRLDDEDERVVRVAVAGLTGRRPQALEEWVIRSLADGRMSEKFLIETLGMIATNRSRATAISMLRHPDVEVRSICAAILEQIGDRSCFDALAAALHGSVLAMEKRLALPAGDPVAEDGEFAELLDGISTVGEKLGMYTFDKNGLQTLLHSAREHEQLVAISHLAEEKFFDRPFLDGGAGDSDFADRLQALATSRSPVMRAFAYDVLGKSTRSEAGEILVGGVADPVFQVRFGALEALVHYTATTGRRTPLRSIYDRRHEFEPSTYASDDPDLLMRARLEQAIRGFEPSWASVARARAEIGSGKMNASALLAAAFLAPRQEAMSFLLDALKAGPEGAKTFALRSIKGRAGKKHVEELRAILAAETNADRQEALAQIIARASD